MYKYKFSVIIPTYNRADLLDRCLNSLADQTFKDFEVLVCDDGSTDNSKEIAEKYLAKLNLTYIWNENWGGPARPRNVGLNASQGEWICFLDSDDWWTPNKLEVCLPYLSDYDMLYHDMQVYNQATNKFQEKMRGCIIENYSTGELLTKRNQIINSSVVLRKSIVDIVGKITEDKALVAVEDFDYWLRVFEHTRKIKYIPLVLGYYFIGQNVSASLKQIDRKKALFSKYEACFNTKQYKKATALFNYDYARLYHMHKQYTLAKRSYKIAIKGSANIPKSIAGYILAMVKVNL